MWKTYTTVIQYIQYCTAGSLAEGTLQDREGSDGKQNKYNAGMNKTQRQPMYLPQAVGHILEFKNEKK